MKIDRNIILSLHIVFSLCARVGWCDVCTDFTNVTKVGVDVDEMSLLNILEDIRTKIKQKWNFYGKGQKFKLSQFLHTSRP